MLSKLNLLKEVKDYFMIALGTSLYALGYAMFLLPYKLASGGVSGISAIIYYMTGFEAQYSYAIINIALLIVGLKILGWRFCLKTIYGVAMCTFWMWAFQRLIEDANGVLPQLLGDERFMAVILGALLEGMALSICFANNGSTGGTDIIAACVNKYKDVSLGQMILACDVIIVSSCYFIFDDVQMVIFGYVMMAIAAISLDYLTRMMHQAVEFKIFSRNYAKIADAIRDAGFGVTVMDGTGWYTKTERKVVVCIASKRYDKIIAQCIKRVDPYAFVSVTHIEGVYGEGFSTMKTKVKDQKPIIVFATNNANKLREVREMIGDKYELRSLEEIGCNAEIPETHDTLQENALQKAQFIKQYYGFDCFADDTGLEVTALGGKPGVYSARYATISEDGWEARSDSHNSEENMEKLLQMLDGKEDRSAQFRTVIAFINDGDTLYFEGIVKGNITTTKHGTDGFGYDPVFRPHGYSETFAEMSHEEKNKISHRGEAVRKLVEYLNR